MKAVNERQSRKIQGTADSLRYNHTFINFTVKYLYVSIISRHRRKFFISRYE
jgi:hypothetical protein